MLNRFATRSHTIILISSWNGSIRNASRKKPVRRTIRFPILSHQLKQVWGKHDVVVFASFPLINLNGHPLTFDIIYFKSSEFRVVEETFFSFSRYS
jgi:hypothetical protein